MDDKEILKLYLSRDETALAETAGKYGRYCHTIAYNILGSDEDAAECVNDTWLAVWNAIPPHSPEILSTFLGKLTRRNALNRWRDSRRDKRGGGQLSLALDELAEVIPDHGSVEDGLMAEELTQAVNRFLSTLPDAERRVFLCRYWYLDSIDQICLLHRFTPGKVNSMLHRTRNKLRIYLKKEGLL